MKALSILLCLAAFPLFSAAQNQSEPPVSAAPLTADEISIYRAFLSTYTTGLNTPINLSDTTVPFTPRDIDLKGCLQDFGFVPASDEIHHFTTEFSELSNYRLVNPKAHRISDPENEMRNGASVKDAVTAGFKAGIFTLSEIRFDSKHQRAAFSYGFYCGRLCGNGATLIFELRDGKWVDSHSRCSFWES